jgi:hypothetical protein
MVSLNKILIIIAILLFGTILVIIVNPVIYYTNEPLLNSDWLYGELDMGKYYRREGFPFVLFQNIPINNVSVSEKYLAVTIFEKYFIIKNTKNLFNNYHVEENGKIKTFYKVLPKVDTFKIRFSSEKLSSIHEILVPFLVELKGSNEWTFIIFSTCALGNCTYLDSRTYGERKVTLPNIIKNDTKEIILLTPYVVKYKNNTLVQPEIDNVRIYEFKVLSSNNEIIAKLV